MTNGFWPPLAERRDLVRSEWTPSLVDGQKEESRRIVDTRLERERGGFFVGFYRVICSNDLKLGWMDRLRA